MTVGDTVYRFGYSKGDQPIGTGEIMFNILAPAVIEEHITFGMTKSLTKNSEINLAAMYAKNHSISGPNYFTTDPGTGAIAQNLSIEMKQYELEASYSRSF